MEDEWRGFGTRGEVWGSQRGLGDITKLLHAGLEYPKKICEGWKGFGAAVRISGRTVFFGEESQGDMEVFEWSRGVFCGSWGYFVCLGKEDGCPRGILGVPGGFWGSGEVSGAAEATPRGNGGP